MRFRKKRKKKKRIKFSKVTAYLNSIMLDDQRSNENLHRFVLSIVHFKSYICGKKKLLYPIDCKEFQCEFKCRYNRNLSKDYRFNKKIWLLWFFLISRQEAKRNVDFIIDYLRHRKYTSNPLKSKSDRFSTSIFIERFTFSRSNQWEYRYLM